MFEEQDRIEAEILTAYKNGKLSAELEPYFRWKQGSSRPTHREVLTMRAECSSWVEVIWESEQPDDLVAAYYSYVENELLRIDISSLLEVIQSKQIVRFCG